MENKLSNEWNDNAVIVPSNQSVQFESHGNTLKVIVATSVTNNHFGLYGIEMAPKARGPKLHYHKLMDETFIVLQGIVTILTAEGETKAAPGTVVHIPRYSVHGYNNDSDSIAKMTMIFNPGQNREDFFRKMYQMLDENPDDLEAFQKLYRENDSYSLNFHDMIPLQTTSS